MSRCIFRGHKYPMQYLAKGNDGDVQAILDDVHYLSNMRGRTQSKEVDEIFLLGVKREFELLEQEGKNPKPGDAGYKQWLLSKTRREMREEYDETETLYAKYQLLGEDEFIKWGEDNQYPDFEKFLERLPRLKERLETSAERTRAFLEQIFKDRDAIPTGEVKKLAVKSGDWQWKDEETETLEGWDSLRKIAERDGYTGGSYGTWTKPQEKLAPILQFGGR